MDLRTVLIKKVFPALRREGLIARTNFWCCRSCGSAAGDKLAVGRKKKGFVFWHGQSDYEYKCAVRARKENPRAPLPGIYLHYGAANKEGENQEVTEIRTDKEKLKIGRQIARECRKAKLVVSWNGKIETAIYVRKWSRRRSRRS